MTIWIVPPLGPPSGGVPGPALPPGAHERKADVYVLKEHLAGRAYKEKVNPNAAAKDLAAIYAVDELRAYPVIKDNFERRELKKGMRVRVNRAWASFAIDALLAGQPVPALPGRMKRDRAVMILKSLMVAGPLGATRKEICTDHGVDGGKVSGALSALHEAGVIFPLDGVKR